MASSFVVWFKDADTHTTSILGRAAKHFGNLTQAGFPIAPGFIVTSAAYHAFLKENKLDSKIKKLLTTINTEHPESIYQVTEHIKNLIAQGAIPKEITKEIKEYYNRINSKKNIFEAHTIAKPSHKIAKQTVTDFESLEKMIKNVWVQHFEPNNFWRRYEHGHDHIDSGVEIIIQQELHTDKKGMLHTIDVHTHKKDVVTITVNHAHTSDAYTLSKKNLMLLERKLSHYGKAPKLTYEELMAIAKLGREVEQHLYFPQEIEWAFADGQLYIIQTKPFSDLPKNKPESRKKLAIARGISITKTIGSGPVTIIHHENELEKAKNDSVIVITAIQKNQIEQLKKAKGIITEKGELHSEISALIRQLGIPTIYGVTDATKRLKHGHVVTIHAGKGEIYLGGFH